MNKNVPVDKKLYNDVKKEAKKRFKVWPSAYASGWLVKEYKKRGGKYKVEKTPKRKTTSGFAFTLRCFTTSGFAFTLRCFTTSGFAFTLRCFTTSGFAFTLRCFTTSGFAFTLRCFTTSGFAFTLRCFTTSGFAFTLRCFTMSGFAFTLRCFTTSGFAFTLRCFSKSRRRKTPKRKSKSRHRKTPKRKSKSRRRKTPKRKSKSRRRNYGLNRWFDEEWIDVCKLPKIVKCGRDKAEWKNYPYCRPRKRINKKTPKTASELTKAEIKKRCAKKKKNPSKRVLPKRKTKSILRKSSSFMNNWNKGWFIVSKEEGKCKYCEEAKKLLSTKVKSYNVEILTDTNKEEIYNRVDKITNNYRYFPMIFYNGKFIGGYTELKEYKF